MPTRYSTGAELYWDFAREVPPFSSTPNPQPQRPSTEGPHRFTPNKDEK